MNKRELTILVKELIKNDWVVFEDNTDKEYFLKELRTEPIEDVLPAIENSKIKQGAEYIQDMVDELEGLE